MVLQFYRGIILDWCLNNGSYSLVKAVEQALPLIYGGIKPEQQALPGGGDTRAPVRAGQA